MKSKILAAGLFAALLLSSGCTDAYSSKVGGLGSEHKVELYSGGVLVRSWISTGKVLSSEQSDGYFFRDKETKVNVEVSGTIVITRID